MKMRMRKFRTNNIIRITRSRSLEKFVEALKSRFLYQTICLMQHYSILKRVVIKRNKPNSSAIESLKVSQLISIKSEDLASSNFWLFETLKRQLSDHSDAKSLKHVKLREWSRIFPKQRVSISKPLY